MIRRAEIGDIEVIREIAEKAYRPYVARLGKKPAPMVADFEKHIVDDWAIVFEQQVVLGYAVVLVGKDPILLDNIAVDTDVQRQGIGRVLIDRVERHVIELGHRYYDLYTNIAMTENIRWYKKLGLVETRRIEEDDFKRVYMRKQLVTSPIQGLI